MKILGPVLTLGIGAVVAGAIALANANLTGGDAAAAPTETLDASAPVQADAVPAADTATAPAATPAATPAAAPAAAPDPAASAAATPPAPAIDWSYAGKVSDPVLSMALRIVGDRAAAYICDGGAYELWLYGTAVDGVLTLTGEQGQTLTGRFDADRAWGDIDGGWSSWTFDVPRKDWPDWAGDIAPGSLTS